MTPCPDRATLVAFSHDALGEHMAVLVAEHLDQCAICRGQVRTADDLAPWLTALTPPDPPAPLLQSVLDHITRPSHAPRPSDRRPAIALAGIGFLWAGLWAGAARPADLDAAASALHVATAGLPEAFALVSLVAISHYFYRSFRGLPI